MYEQEGSAVVTASYDRTLRIWDLRSNNREYRLHPIASKQITPRSAAQDAARLLLIHQEYYNHRDDFLMKAALLLNKIDMASK